MPLYANESLCGLNSLLFVAFSVRIVCTCQMFMKPSDLGERAIKESYIALDPDSDHETYHTRFCASLIAPSDALCPSFLHLAPMFAVTHHPCFRKSTPIMQ